MDGDFHEIGYAHGSLTSHPIDKLFSSVKEKVKAGQPIDNVPELKKLWKNVMHNTDAVTADCSSEALIQLIKDGHLEIEEALEKITSSSAAVKNIKWLVHLTFQLLKMEYLQKSNRCEHCNKFYGKSSFQLHSHTHPLIFILNSAPHSWCSIVAELQATFIDAVQESPVLNVSSLIEMLEPFLVYIFLNPSTEGDVMKHKESLFLSFISILSYNTSSKELFNDHCANHSTLAQFVLDSLCLMTITETHLQFYNHLYSMIKSSVLAKNPSFIKQFLFSIISTCFSLRHRPVFVGLSCLLYQVLKIASAVSEVGIISLCLANLICRAYPAALPYLMKCVMNICESTHWLHYSMFSRVALLFGLKAAILQLLLNKNSLAYSKHLPLLYKTISHIEHVAASWVNDQVNCSSVRSTSIMKISLPFHDSWLSEIVYILQQLHLCDSSSILSSFQYLLQTRLSENIGLTSALIVCGIFLGDLVMFSLNELEYKMVLDLLSKIVLFYPQLSFPTLPSIFFAIKSEKSSSKQKTLLRYLPEFAINQNAMPLVLRAILAIGEQQRLYSLAIFLLLRLWKKHDRCFPYLQKIMSQKFSFSPTVKLEVDTSSALVLKQLCQMKAFDHASEILAMISAMLKKPLHPGQTTLLLDSLYYLLKNEVVDIRSTWFELIKDLLTAYRDTAVTKSILKILSLVPMYDVENPNFVQFKSETLHWVWHHISNSNSDVEGAALLCLAHFKREDLIIKHLPACLQPPQLDETPSEGFLMNPISSNCFIDVVKAVPRNDEAQYFCSSLLTQELLSLPRDIKDRAFRAQKQNSQGSVLDDFSSFILKKHERNKQPNLKSSFATGVLMCYNPSLDEVPKDLVTLSRYSFQLLQSLLGEVTTDVKNWKSLLWIVRAWKKFMHVCFSTMVKGRNAELNLQFNQKDSDKDDIKHKQAVVEFWCRDKIIDLLKSSSKGTPTMQGNSLLALAGLFCCVKSFKMQKTNEAIGSSEVEGSGFLSNDHWLGMAADTLFTAADSKYKAPGRIFSWCQYKSVSCLGRLTTSKFGDICALHAIGMMSRAIIAHDLDRVKNILQLLASHLTDFSKQGEESGHDQSLSSVAMLHLNLVLGKLCGHSYEKNLHESSDDVLCEMLAFCSSILVENATKFLGSSLNTAGSGSDDECDNYSSDEDSEDIITSLLGVCELLPKIFCLNNSPLQKSAITLFNLMFQYLEKLSDQSGGFLEAFYFAFVPACIAARKAKCIDSDLILSVLLKVKNLFLASKNIPSSIAISHLCLGLSTSGDRQAAEMLRDMFSEFMKQASNERLPTRQKLASINGLVALLGSEVIFSGHSPELTQESEGNMRQVVNLLKQFTQTGRDAGITSNSVVLLGHLYLSLHSSSLLQSSTLPDTFSYLTETSVLKPMFKILFESGKDDGFLSDSVAKIVLNSLSEVAFSSKRILPPVNWFAPLSKLIQLELNETEQISCLQIGLSQSSDNQTAAAFITNCIAPVQFESLYSASRCVIFANLDIVVQNLPSSTVLAFLPLVRLFFFQNSNPELQNAILSGVLACLLLKSLLQDISGLLVEFVQRVIAEHPFCLSNKILLEQWTVIAQCVAECSDQFDLDAEENICLPVLFVKCQILLKKRITALQGLNKTLQVCCQRMNEDVQCDSLWIIFDSLNKYTLRSSGKKELRTWLQELFGTVLKQWGNHSCDRFHLKLICTCLMTLTKCKLAEIPRTDTTTSVKDQRLFLWDQCLTLLPNVVKEFLVQNNTNEAISSQTIDFFLNLYESDLKRDPLIKNCLALVFRELVHVKIFQRTSLWTKIASKVILK